MTAINPIEELLRDPDVTEIMVDAPDQVMVERRGRIEHTGVQFLDEEHVLSTIELMVSSDGCRCDIRYDGRGPQRYHCRLHREGAPFDGSRVSAIRDDADGHWKLNIRKCGNDDDVIASHQHIDDGFSSQSMADYYRSLVLARMGISSDAEVRKVELRSPGSYLDTFLPSRANDNPPTI